MTQAFNLSQLANKVNTSGQLDATSGLSGATPIANGGTNNASLSVTAGGVLYTDGSKVVNVGAGTTNQVLTSQGSSPPIWQTASSGFTNMQVFTSPTAFTTPSSTTKMKITVVGGGAGGATNGTYGGGAGGTAIYVGAVTASTPYPITVGAGGATGPTGNSGGTSSFGVLASATGGASAPATSTGGAGTTGTFLITGGAASSGAVVTVPIPLGGSNTYSSSGAGGSSSLGGDGAYGSGGRSSRPSVPTPARAGTGGVVIVEY